MDEALIAENMNLVHYFANRYRKQMEYDELIGIGNIGLVNAAIKFDENKGIKFSTFASTCINKQMLMAIRKSKQVQRSRYITINLEDVFYAKDGDEIRFIDRVESEEDTQRDVERNFAIKYLKHKIEQLAHCEKFVIKATYGIEMEQITQAEIARYLNISQSYVSRLQRKVLRTLQSEWV